MRSTSSNSPVTTPARGAASVPLSPGSGPGCPRRAASVTSGGQTRQDGLRAPAAAAAVEERLPEEERPGESAGVPPRAGGGGADTGGGASAGGERRETSTRTGSVRASSVSVGGEQVVAWEEV